MVTTKPIKAGEQIVSRSPPSDYVGLHTFKFNTYGDLPNSDLLRRYGHVDLVPCPHLKGSLGNPQDVVEIRADLVVNVVCGDLSTDETYRRRIDWWLDEGGDEYGTRLLFSLPVLKYIIQRFHYRRRPSSPCSADIFHKTSPSHPRRMGKNTGERAFPESQV